MSSDDGHRRNGEYWATDPLLAAPTARDGLHGRGPHPVAFCHELAEHGEGQQEKQSEGGEHCRLDERGMGVQCHEIASVTLERQSASGWWPARAAIVMNSGGVVRIAGGERARRAKCTVSGASYVARLERLPQQQRRDAQDQITPAFQQ